jgi:DNA-directed RNA polymerase subunit M/transcription elongation factor TFIIS
MPYIIWSRRCKKCKGQLYYEEAEDGKYLTCIQCGYSEKICDEDLAQILEVISPTRKKSLSKT